jgi:hypothetical protein
MDFALTPNQRRLQQEARRIADTVIAPRAAEVDRSEAYPWDNVAALRDAGLMGYTIPQAYGGAGGSFLDAAIIIEEMARVCGVTGRIAVEANMGAISAVMHYGSEAQKRLAAELVLGGDKPAICITEPDAGSAATDMTTRADRRAGHYVLNGRKHWITGGGVSRLHLIFARIFDENGRRQGIGGFLAVRDDAGTTQGLIIGRREPAMGLRGIPETEVIFEDLLIPDDMVLCNTAGRPHGFADLMDAYNSQRVGAATVALGLAQGAFEAATNFARERHQFGRPIAARHPSGRRQRRSVSRSVAGRAGETARLRDGDTRHQRRVADVRRARLLAQFSDGAHGTRRAHVHHRRRHRAGAAQFHCRQGAGLEAAADTARNGHAGVTIAQADRSRHGRLTPVLRLPPSLSSWPGLTRLSVAAL